VGLHGKNLTDEEYKVGGYFFPALGLEGTITAFYGNPRQYWLDVQYRWFRFFPEVYIAQGAAAVAAPCSVRVRASPTKP
jgi:hypothetical protein